VPAFLVPLLLAHSFFSLSPPAAAEERDLSLSICYNYQVEPPPVPRPDAPSVPKCRVIGRTMYIDGGIFPDEYAFELTAHYPEVTTLQLNSDGGAVKNLYPLTDLIRARGLHTHVLIALVLGLNLAGDGLSDLLDPRRSNHLVAVAPGPGSST
jgi:hypothetical protein